MRSLRTPHAISFHRRTQPATPHRFDSPERCRSHILLRPTRLFVVSRRTNLPSLFPPPHPRRNLKEEKDPLMERGRGRRNDRINSESVTARQSPLSLKSKSPATSVTRFNCIMHLLCFLPRLLLRLETRNTVASSLFFFS